MMFSCHFAIYEKRLIWAVAVAFVSTKHLNILDFSPGSFFLPNMSGQDYVPFF